jgi:hypothetical protein
MYYHRELHETQRIELYTAGIVNVQKLAGLLRYAIVSGTSIESAESLSWLDGGTAIGRPGFALAPWIFDIQQCPYRVADFDRTDSIGEVR